MRYTWPIAMADIQFEEEQMYTRPTTASPQQSALTRLVLKTGIVRSERAAQYVLLGVAALALIATALIAANAFDRPVARPQAGSIEPPAFKAAREAARR